MNPTEPLESEITATPGGPDGPWPDSTAARALAVTFVARVRAGAPGDRWEVAAGALTFEARRAVGCLIEPCTGDRVACWRVAGDDGRGDEVFIVAVLERADVEAALQIRLGAGTGLCAEDGRLSLQADRGLQMKAPQCTLETDRLEVRSDEVSFVYRSLHSLGELATAVLGQLRLVGGALSTVFERQTHHAEQHFRKVEGLDRVEAKVIQQQAETLLHLQGENVLANGERVVKVQATQIHLG
jgi:hypothetical protein